MSTDTKLTDLVVNTLTRKQYHEADLTGHGDELFVQSDHAGVFVGANGVDAIDTTNVSNCITESPQDIKLELSSGTLTLKAGSKVYVPNGAGVFDAVTLPSDLSSSSANGYLWFLNNTKTGLAAGSIANCYSGTTEPTGANGVFWYDTTNNVVKRHNGSSWVSGFSLPIGITDSSGTLQVFNGKGYMYSTRWVLPNTKGLISDGFNSDGTAKNIQMTVNNVQVCTYPNNVTVSDIDIWLTSTGDDGGTNANIKYISEVNKVLYTVDGSQRQYCSAGTISIVSGVITKFTPKQAFRAVDYSDTKYIAHQAMPSDKYVDLTLPASGNSITAPADGIFVVTKASNNSLQYLNIQTPNRNAAAAVAQSSGQNVTASLLVSKGDVVTAYYNLGGATQVCRLIYANGAK